MVANIKTINCEGIETQIVKVETKINKGMNKFIISGFTSRTITEAKERVISSIKANGIRLPYGKIVTNLLPAGIKKIGTHYDLPIAISILNNVYDFINLDDYIICGELGINGDLIPIHNPIRIVNFAKINRINNIIIPKGDYEYINLESNINIYQAKSLKEVINHLRNIKLIVKEDYECIVEEKNNFDINDLLSLKSLVRALIISITGKHNILIKGPIGTGKTISIKAITSLFNDLENEKSMILSDIFTRFTLNNIYIKKPQIIYPSNNIKYNSLFGTKNKIGEIALSNFGFLCFDEINLFSKNIIDNLKNFMDNDDVFKFNKIKYFGYPVDSCIIATMNPCPCGNYGTNIKCSCSQSEISRHNRYIDNALLDRFAIKIIVNKAEYVVDENYDIKNIKKNIQRAKEIQELRYKDTELSNGTINSKQLNMFICFEHLKDIIKKIEEKYNLSKRAIDNIIKVSRTIADYDGREKIDEKDILEALRYHINIKS